MRLNRPTVVRGANYVAYCAKLVDPRPFARVIPITWQSEPWQLRPNPAPEPAGKL